MITIDLSNISKENAFELLNDNLMGLVFNSDENDFEDNFKHYLNKARECGNYDEVLKSFQLASAVYHVDLPKISAKLTSLAGIETIHTKWLWYPYIPLGKITLMTADPGTGKTFFSLYLAAAVSDGRPFFGQDFTYVRKPRVAVYQTAEDGIADTIKPRLEPMNPDFNNIYFIDETHEPLTLSEPETIEQAMRELNPALMIFDPLQAYLGANVDMHRANEVRPVLAQIGHLAERYGCAVILIMHNSKMSNTKALYRGLGSIDIPAVARSMLIMGNHPEKPGIKVLCHEKSSLAKHGDSIEFEIAPERGGILFSGFSDLKAIDVIDVSKNTRNKPSVTKDTAADALRELLGDKGYAKLDDIKALQDDMGFSRGTLYNAKEDLQLQNVSAGYSENKATYWLMPNIDKEKFKELIKNQSNSNSEHEEPISFDINEFEDLINSND